MSPEVATHQIEQYLQSIDRQVDAARNFFFGHIETGMQILSSLPQAVQDSIDQMILEANDFEPVNPLKKEGSRLIASMIMHQLEKRLAIN